MSNKTFQYLVGMPLEEAMNAVTAAGYTWRVSFKNGTPMLLTQDVNPTRVNLDVEDGKVVGVMIG